MKNVLLIAPTGAEDPGIEAYAAPHHGLHRIAGYLRDRGHHVAVWDKWYSDLSLDEILQTNFAQYDRSPGWNLIGFSTISHTLPQDIKAMRQARKLCPESILVAGGMESAMNFQEIFDHTDIDGVVLSEGEYVLADLLDDPAGIPAGMLWRRRARPYTSEDLWACYEKIDFGSMDYPRYWERIRQLTGNPDYEPDIRLVTETHCNRDCVFCSQTNFARRATGKVQPPAMLTADQIFELVARAKSQLPGLKRVYFDGDDFCLDRARAIEYFSVYSQRGPLEGFKYLLEAGLPHLDEELIRTMAGGGLKLLNMGLENCSQKILHSLGKNQSVERCFEVMGWCRESGIEPYVLILLFPPESTPEDLRLNVNVLKNLMQEGATLSIISMMRPYRGTRLYEMDYEFGWEAVPLEGGGNLKRPWIVWCTDSEARGIQEKFLRAWQKRLDKIKAQGRDAFRRRTAPEMVQLLEDLLVNAGY